MTIKHAYLLGVGAAILGGCQRSQAPQPPVRVAPAESSVSAAVDSTRAPASAPQSPAPVKTVLEPQDAALTVATASSGSTAAGASVTVTGRCARMTALRAFGPPPRTRSDWQLTDLSDTTAAIWVVGERPSDCSYDAGSAAAITVTGLVAVDSVKRLDGTRVARRFLLLRRP